MHDVERQTNCGVKKIVLDGRNDYIKKTRELGADGIEVCVTAGYTSQENATAERMNCIVKYAIKTMPLHWSAPAILLEELL